MTVRTLASIALQLFCLTTVWALTVRFLYLTPSYSGLPSHRFLAILSCSGACIAFLTLLPARPTSRGRLSRWLVIILVTPLYLAITSLWPSHLWLLQRFGTQQEKITIALLVLIYLLSTGALLASHAAIVPRNMIGWRWYLAYSAVTAWLSALQYHASEPGAWETNNGVLGLAMWNAVLAASLSTLFAIAWPRGFAFPLWRAMPLRTALLMIGLGIPIGVIRLAQAIE